MIKKTGETGHGHVTGKNESYDYNDHDHYHAGQVDDPLIASSVQSVRVALPEGLDARVSGMLTDMETMEGNRSESGDLQRRRNRFGASWFPLTAAAMLLLALIFMPRPGAVTGNGAGAAQPPAEIKTEFELNDANIKILWVQKKDFQLRRNTK